MMMIMMCTATSKKSLLSILLLIAAFPFSSHVFVEGFRRHPSSLLEDDNTIQQQQQRNLKTKNDLKQSFIESSKNSRSTNESTTLPKPSDHLITNLPYLDSNTLSTKQYAGHIPASNEDDKYFFYWLFEPDMSSGSDGLYENEEEIPLLIWLNGGPGCSSMVRLRQKRTY